VQTIERYGGPPLVGAFAVVLAAWSWGKWPDPQIDFGQQLYIAWRIAEGEVLYRDLAWHHGALSPYLNALWFRIFGVGLRTLALCNLAILAALLLGLYRILTEIADRRSAVAALMVFLTCFAFGQQTGYGNYNFVCPYEHGVTHGLLLAIAALLLLWRYAHRGGLVSAAGLGLVTGLAFLTKAEVFLALAAAVGAGLAVALQLERARSARLARTLCAFAVAAAAPPLVACLLFALAMPFGDAVLAALGPWPSVFASDATQTVFHRRGLGTLNAAENVKEILAWLGRYALVLLPAAGLADRLRSPGPHRPLFAASAVFTLMALLVAVDLRWYFAARPLPVVLTAIAVASVIVLYREGTGSARRARDVLRVSFAIFSLALLAKMALNTRTHHYGFALAMPATLTAVVALVGWVPGWITRRGGYGGLFCVVALTLLAFLAVHHLRTSQRFFEQRTHMIASGADRFQAGGRGRMIDTMVSAIAERVRPDQTLTVLPDGAMINYLSRRVNSTPYNYFAPTALAIYGEARMLASFESSPPDFVVLVHKNAFEFGYRFFGDGYGEPLMRWLRAHYQPAFQVGHAPLQDKRFGVLLLERVSAVDEGR
jgi:hypothetical protein